VGVALGHGGEVCLLLVVVVTAPTQKKPN
jgi:hypothetical protein